MKRTIFIKFSYNVQTVRSWNQSSCFLIYENQFTCPILRCEVFASQTRLLQLQPHVSLRISLAILIWPGFLQYPHICCMQNEKIQNIERSCLFLSQEKITQSNLQRRRNSSLVSANYVPKHTSSLRCKFNKVINDKERQ